MARSYVALDAGGDVVAAGSIGFPRVCDEAAVVRLDADSGETLSLQTIDGTHVSGQRLRVRTGERHRLALTPRDRDLLAPSRGGPADPTREGAVLEVEDRATDARFVIDLPRRGWRGRRGARRRGPRYAFAGKGRYRRVVLESAGRLAIRCKLPLRDERGLAVEARDLAVKLTLGGLAPYCLEFGGVVVRDDPGRFVAMDAPRPATCR